MNLSIQSVSPSYQLYFLFLFLLSLTVQLLLIKEPDVLDLVFILDKSGSMSGFETDNWWI